MNMAAPDFADKIAERLAARYLTITGIFDADERQIITMLVSVGVREGYIIGLGVNS